MACCVCSVHKESSDNRLFRCGGQGCGIIVHQACYGIVTVPAGQWFCRKCESQERAVRVKCELCPRKDGALKRTDSGGWAHVVCALYIPEVTFGNLRTMEPIITSKLPRERFSKTCYICEDQGQEMQATTGACMSCHKSNCRLAFHVTCAQKEQQLVEEEDPRDKRNIIYCGYCHLHYKRMMKQKYKQNMRSKQGQALGGTSAPMEVSSVEVVTTAPPPHHHPLTDAITTRDIMTGGGHLPKHHTKPKDPERLSNKRPSSDLSFMPSMKRKHRRRKLSSSNESSTSEAPSTASEMVLPNMPGSPSGVSLQSPGSSHGGKRTEDGGEHSAHPMDNLDLLASVTERVDEADRMTVGKSHSTPLSPSYVPQTTISVETAPNMEETRETTTANKAARSKGEGTREGRGNKAGGNNPPMRKNKKPASSNTPGNNSRSMDPTNSSQAPPTSLQELLERQWEQTAQFILDQSGRQNHAGVMLAHLHELQSENRTMQTRIMELASQREFFIATNSRLRQTLNEGGFTKVLNGIQLLSSDSGQSLFTGQTPPPTNGLVMNDAQLQDRGTIDLGTSDITTATSRARPEEDQLHPSHFHEPQEHFERHTSYTNFHNHGRHIEGHAHLPGTHEVTRVTNTVEGSIAYTGFPNSQESPSISFQKPPS